MSILDVLDPSERKLARKARFPNWVEPMKATLVHEAFSDPDWIFEPKLDGERCVVYKKGEEIRLMSRNEKSIGGSYPEIVAALASQKVADFVIDGEVVALKNDIPSFGMLQQRMHVIAPTKELLKNVPVVFNIFDVMHVEGHDVTALPLLARKKLLAKTVRAGRVLVRVDHRVEEGERYYEEMCGTPGQEGVIAKRAASTYQHSRSKDWLKFKCSLEQEFVIGGYTEPQGSRVGLGALLVGFYEGKDLRYAGKVGTGFGDELLRMLTTELRKIERDTSPFVDLDIKGKRSAHWVEPKLVAQIGFSEWTGTNRLRHPRFIGLRRDKNPKKVVREP